MGTTRKNPSKAPHPFGGTTKEPVAPRGGSRDGKKRDGVPERFAPPDLPPRNLNDIPDDVTIHHVVCAKEQIVSKASLEGIKDDEQIYCVSCRGAYPASTFSHPSTKKAIA